MIQNVKGTKAYHEYFLHCGPAIIQFCFLEAIQVLTTDITSVQRNQFWNNNKNQSCNNRLSGKH